MLQLQSFAWRYRAYSIDTLSNRVFESEHIMVVAGALQFISAELGFESIVEEGQYEQARIQY